MRKSIFLLCLLFVSACTATPTFQDDFSDGHEYIMPNPSAEFNFTIVDEAGESVNDAAVFVYLDAEKMAENRDFIDYDGAVGYPADADGRVSFVFLGDFGGGYERLSSDAPDPTVYLVIEADGVEIERIDLINYLFREQETGEKPFDLGDRQINLLIFEQTVTLAK